VPTPAPDSNCALCQAYAAAALKDEAASVGTTPEGERNDRLNRAAFNLGQLVPHGFLDLEIVVTALHAAALAAGLEERETARTIMSGTSKGGTPRNARDLAEVHAKHDEAAQNKGAQGGARGQSAASSSDPFDEPPHRRLKIQRLSEVTPLTAEQLSSPTALPLWRSMLAALVGEGESCKSLLAAHTALDLARAGRTVLILDGEMSAPSWRRRLTELGATLGELGQLYYSELGEAAADVAEIRAVCEQLGIALVVWDSALSLISRTARSENDNAEVSKVYDRLREIVRDGPAGLIVDHTARGADNLISRGATAKFNALDMSYGVKLDGGVPNLNVQWKSLITIEKDRHGLHGDRYDLNAIFQPLGNRNLHVEIAKLESVSHRLAPYSDTMAKIVKDISRLVPPPTSPTDADKRLRAELHGHRKQDVLKAYKYWYATQDRTGSGE
jgi:hypothetical protein